MDQEKALLRSKAEFALRRKKAAGDDVTKRLADLVLEDTLKPVSEHERFPATKKDIPAKRERSRIIEPRNPATGQLLRKQSVK